MQLIKVNENEQGQQIVSARDLWKFLDVNYDFSTWIKRRIEKYDFIEDEDFIRVSFAPQICGAKGRGATGGYNKLDYILSLDMAKELAMIENNSSGRAARRYFIQCEKRYRELLLKNHKKELDNLQLEINEVNKHKDRIKFLIKSYEEIYKCIEKIYAETEKQREVVSESNRKLNSLFFNTGLCLNESKNALKKLEIL